ncbi:hypothetical protein H6504_02150 [Candidatus Woesearchaeota archaeon]|nr:hypothetical protein [Candidatus Woesearchaeota archaeon]
MKDPLDKYIEDQHAKGFSDDKIKHRLKESGYSPDIISAHFKKKTKLAIYVFVILLCISLFFIFPKETQKPGTQFEGCIEYYSVLGMSILEEDRTICSELEEVDSRQQCEDNMIFLSALDAKDLTACQNIRYLPFQGLCQSFIAKDVTLCRQAVENLTNNPSGWCDLAIHGKKCSSCDEKAMGEGYFDLTKWSEDNIDCKGYESESQALCSLLNNRDIQKFISGAKTICADALYLDTAIMGNLTNEAYCNKINDISTREECKAHTRISSLMKEFDMAGCEGLNTQYQELCRDRVSEHLASEVRDIWKLQDCEKFRDADAFNLCQTHVKENIDRNFIERLYAHDVQQSNECNEITNKDLRIACQAIVTGSLDDCRQAGDKKALCALIIAADTQNENACLIIPDTEERTHCINII